MKRISSNAAPSPNATAEPAPATRRSRKSAVSKPGRYSPAEVHKRTLVLASRAEQTSGKFDVKLRQPSVYSDTDRTIRLLDLPEDALKQIFPHVDHMAARALTLSCRIGYHHAHILNPLRRLRGLLHDLGRLSISKRSKNLPLDPDSFKAFLEAISAGGDYDRVLLTPLSQPVRCAASIAMAAWAQPKLSSGNEVALAAVMNFFDENYASEFSGGVEAILDFHLGVNAHVGSVWDKLLFWKNIFSHKKLDREAKGVIFEALFYRLCDRNEDFFDLARIACEHKLDLQAATTGILALTVEESNKFSEELSDKLAKLDFARRDMAIRQILNWARFNMSRPADPDRYARTLTSFLEVSLLPSRTNLSIFPRMVSELNRLVSIIKCRCLAPISFDHLLFSESSNISNVPGHFINLLINEICEHNKQLDAEKLLREILFIFHSAGGDHQQVDQYIRTMIAGLR